MHSFYSDSYSSYFVETMSMSIVTVMWALLYAKVHANTNSLFLYHPVKRKCYDSRCWNRSYMHSLRNRVSLLLNVVRTNAANLFMSFLFGLGSTVKINRTSAIVMWTKIQTWITLPLWGFQYSSTVLLNIVGAVQFILTMNVPAHDMQST